MNDRFKFRGITKGKVNEFVYGSLLWYAGEPQIWNKDGKNYIVQSKTLGQCTGLKDKNGKLIYEGDIVLFLIDELFCKMKIVWDDDEFDFKAIGLKKSVEHYERDFKYLSCIDSNENDLEVIGNIYENKELLDEHN